MCPVRYLWIYGPFSAKSMLERVNESHRDRDTICAERISVMLARNDSMSPEARVWNMIWRLECQKCFGDCDARWSTIANARRARAQTKLMSSRRIIASSWALSFSLFIWIVHIRKMTEPRLHNASVHTRGCGAKLGIEENSLHVIRTNYMRFLRPTGFSRIRPNDKKAILLQKNNTKRHDGYDIFFFRWHK